MHGLLSDKSWHSSFYYLSHFKPHMGSFKMKNIIGISNVSTYMNYHFDTIDGAITSKNKGPAWFGLQRRGIPCTRCVSHSGYFAHGDSKNETRERIRHQNSKIVKIMEIMFRTIRKLRKGPNSNASTLLPM